MPQAAAAAGVPSSYEIFFVLSNFKYCIEANNEVWTLQISSEGRPHNEKKSHGDQDVRVTRLQDYLTIHTLCNEDLVMLQLLSCHHGRM